jgi:hypothetical protein
MMSERIKQSPVFDFQMDKFNARNVAAAGGRVTQLSPCVVSNLFGARLRRRPAAALRLALRAQPRSEESEKLPATVRCTKMACEQILSR